MSTPAGPLTPLPNWDGDYAAREAVRYTRLGWTCRVTTGGTFCIGLRRERAGVVRLLFTDICGDGDVSWADLDAADIAWLAATIAQVTGEGR